MSSLNRVMLIGNLGAAPESRAFADGTPVCSLRVATTDRWRDKESGDMKEATEWHRVVMFRRLAEIAGQHLLKGSQVYIEGRLRTRKWVDKNGTERYSTEIEADELKMLGRKPEASPLQPKQYAAAGSAPVMTYGYDPEDKIPF